MNKKIIFLAILFFSFEALTYIGPGMGGGVIAAIIGFFAAIVLGIWGILYYPIKRALKNKKNKENKKDE